MKLALKIVLGLLVAICLFFGVATLLSKSRSSSDTQIKSSQPLQLPNKDDDSVYFNSCTDAKNAGYSNIPEGKPGYRAELDRDGDGVACESFN